MKNLLLVMLITISGVNASAQSITQSIAKAYKEAPVTSKVAAGVFMVGTLLHLRRQSALSKGMLITGVALISINIATKKKRRNNFRF
jgi:hypothetical protein|tara:strand:+ start:968 stop:1228 length:261 start_codon:yes stop_codon:yes gene_type:complete